MAFQTNVLRGGEWVTETVDLQTVLKANSTAKGPKKQRNKPPYAGLLTQTVVESESINSIVPVRLRSAHHQDVAFVSDHVIYIREFQRDGRLHDVIKLSEFGLGERIRHAGAIGCLSDEFESENQGATVKIEDDLVAPLGFSLPETSNITPELPPQMLLIVLETGDCVFLFLRYRSDGQLEFVKSRFQSPKDRLVSPGFHLAVDPSSRYIALACAANFFVVYELESYETLRERYRQNQPLDPIRTYRPRSAHGVIHKIDFLYPRPGDDEHVILLLIMVRNQASRMITYEWEAGEDLNAVLSQEKNGHRMPADNQLPLLIIPLTIRSAFIVVAEGKVAVCTESLHGPPKFDAFDVRAPDPTDAYYTETGPADPYSTKTQTLPLWTAWARPVRQKLWFRAQDCVYLAREDGVVMFIEADPDGLISCSTLVDKLDCSIYSAFTCLYAPYDDILLTAGDSGPGGIWRASPRKLLVSLGTIPNWAPTVDIITVDESSTSSQEASAKGPRVEPWRHRQQLRKPDRIFATSGKGRTGSVTEFRHGLKASISLELEYPGRARQAWILPASLADSSEGFHILLSMPNHSAVIHLSDDYSDATLLDSDVVLYDVASRTLATAQVLDDLVVQISEQCITIIAPENNVKIPFDTILGGGAPSVSVSDAFIRDDCIAVATHIGTKFQISIFKLDRPQLGISHERTLDITGEVSCLTVSPDFVLLAGIWHNGQPHLARCPLAVPGDSAMVALYDHLPHYNGPGEDYFRSMEAVVSIVSYRGLTVLGTRSGEVVTITDSTSRVLVTADKLSLTAVTITQARQSSDTEPAVFVCCDGNLMLLTSHNPHDSDRNAGHFKATYRVWPVDSQALDAPSPSVDYAAATSLLSGSNGVTPMLFLAGERVLLAELQHRPSSIHRSIKLEGTPMRVLYSQYLRCLIVAVSKTKNRPTLLFIDPDTGEDIGRPTDKEGNSLEFISGLGKDGDRIYGLSEWDYKKDGKVWRFILVATKAGRLIVVSTEKIPAESGEPQRIRYWTRMRKSYTQPIYSTLGLDDGMIFGVGETLRWEVLDTEEKKLKEYQTYELGSPATALGRVNGKILILTHRDSLEIFDPPARRGAILENESLVHVDPRVRHAMHMIDMAGTQSAEPFGSIILVSDRDAGLGGLWVPWQSPGRDCEVVFEAELPATIVRFCRGRTRPIWGQERHVPKYGRLVSTADDAEILGICLNGSMQHLTLLNLEAWRLLKFIQKIAMTSEETYPFSYEPIEDETIFDPEPQVDRDTQMHVDGDILRRCLEKRCLERLMSRPAHLARLMDLLDELDNGQHTTGFQPETRVQQCFELAYDILEYYLAPAF